MKCISCGNEIPNSSTVCPFCGKNVEPLSQGAVPVYEAQEQQDFNATPLVTQQDLSGLAVPATPESPALPQDQGMLAQPVAPAVPVGSEVVPEMNAPIPPVPGSGAEVQPEIIKPEMTQTPPVVAATSGVITGGTTPEVTPMAPVTVAPAPAEVTPAETPSGVKESSSAIVAEDKKKAKSRKIVKTLIAVVLVILLVAGGGFAYAYYTQTQTAATRINAIIDQVVKFDSNLNQTLNVASARYSLGGEVSLLGQTYSAKMSGIYAYDIDKKIFDYTVNLEKLNMAGTELIDKDPLSIEFYLADSNLYVLLQNFYEKYIYTEVEGVDEFFENIGKNDVDYLVILNGFKKALKDSLNVANKKQTVKDISIGDTKTKANVITITMNKATEEAVAKAFMNSVANNEALLKELAKFEDDVTEETLKENIKKSIEEYKTDDSSNTNGTLEIYTAMFGNEFYGIRASSNEDGKQQKVEIYPVTDGYKIVCNEDKNEILNITLTHKNHKTSSEIEDSYGLEIALAIDEEVIRVKIEGNTVADVNPKVERANTKESIKLENLPEADMNRILEKIYGFGNLGLVIKDTIESNSTTNPTIPEHGLDDPIYPDNGTY